MNPEAIVPAVSRRLLQLLIEAAHEEVGAKKLPLVLSKVDLPSSFVDDGSLGGLTVPEVAEVYASIQLALRLFYGRGARGTLLRIGRRMWTLLISQAGLREKAELEIARRLPVPARRRRMLELVAGHLREGGGTVRVHLLDVDLLLVDNYGASTYGQNSEEPICYVSMGLIQGALQWATGEEADLEEVACRAMGAPACEFKIKSGGS